MNCKISFNHSYNRKFSKALFGEVIPVHMLHQEWDPTDKQSASARMNRAKADGEILTGLIYVSNDYNDLVGMLNMNERPMNELTEKELCPGQKVLDEINEGFR